MGWPKTTGRSHNKKATTYTSKDCESSVNNVAKQTTLSQWFNKPQSKPQTPVSEKSGCSSTIVTRESDNNSNTALLPNENQSQTLPEEQHGALSSDIEMTSESSVSENSGSESEIEQDINVNQEKPKMNTNTLSAHQIQAKWETQFDFAVYSASNRSWFCSVCKNFGEGSFWRNKSVKLNEHPSRVFTNHEESKQHLNALKQKQLSKRLLATKGNVHTQMVKARRTQIKQNKERNRSVIKIFFKTVYFFTKKNWAVRENFSDIINYIQELGDQEIEKHLKESSIRSHYMSTPTVDEFLKLISDNLEGEVLNEIVAAGNFSLLADETTDMADRAVMSIFIRYADSGTNIIKERYLGLVQIIGSKGSEALCEKICEVLADKGVDVNRLSFHGLVGTNAMSGERTGLQRRLRHLAPHSKYINCRNHRLALVFVHLMKSFENLKDVDATILALWKAFKYSSLKSAVFTNAQEAEGLAVLKLLKAALTRWLSHGNTSGRIIERFEHLVDSLDQIIADKNDPELRVIRQQLLDPDNLLFLLLLADVLQPVNWFSMYLQTRNLVFSTVNNKLNKLLDRLKDIATNDGIYFKTHAENFLKISQSRQVLLRCLSGNNLLDPDQEVLVKIKPFKIKVKAPFVEQQYFLGDFKMYLNQAKKEQTEEIATLVKSKKLCANVIESYKAKHPIQSSIHAWLIAMSSILK